MSRGDGGVWAMMDTLDHGAKAAAGAGGVWDANAASSGDLPCGLFVSGLAAGAIGSQTAPYVPKQSDRPSPVEGDEAGFAPIFDAKTLDGWEGDPTYWRVENGAMVGEITPATIVKSNTFIIWRGGRPKDFELKLDYRITPGGNSGMNYRSASVPDPVISSMRADTTVRTSSVNSKPRAASHRRSRAASQPARQGGHGRNRRGAARCATGRRGSPATARVIRGGGSDDATAPHRFNPTMTDG